ncbi:hypothetical protein BIW11_04565 [Tropilaelaps mercedesae]|uniref:Uncharacterized protein n=1 Tax=Tropilaelaps mercedesae TaxID=418985 RepID=A0A1V9X4K0_9ACAR|nr:hypothetical protein BIW11_04565 [Tropilaelaps mercedesae]
MPPSCLSPARRSLSRERATVSGKSPQSARPIYDCGPGPAYYDCERGDAATYSRTPGFTIRGRSHSPLPDTYPSPAEYAPERADALKYTSVPRYSFGSKHRDHEESDLEPAPNSYRIERADSLRFQSPPRWSFRCSRPTERLSDTPSPNSYRVESCDRQRYPSPPKYSIQRKPNCQVYDKERGGIPGPGHYEPNVYGTIPRAANLANKLEPPHVNRQQQLRYLKRADAELPPKFKFIDDPIDEPVKRKRSEQKKSWFPSFSSAQRKQTKVKKLPGSAEQRQAVEERVNEIERNSRSRKGSKDRQTGDTTDNNITQSLKGHVAARSSWTSPLKRRQKKSETNFSFQGKTLSSSEHPQNQSSTAVQPSTLTSRPLSWAERPLDGRRELRPLKRERDPKSNNATISNRGVLPRGGATRNLLKRSLSFGAKDRADRRENAGTVRNGNLNSGFVVTGGPTLSARRGRSVESLRMISPRFESYSSPTKSFTQKMVHACNIGGAFERWPSLRRMRDTIPAPGVYHIERADALVRPLSPAYTFGGKPADPRPRSTNPAPCDYLPDRADHMVFTSAPSFSFRSKTADPEVIFNERFFNASFYP